MWGLKDRTSENTSQIKTARAGVDLADAVIARLDSQEDEIKQIVKRLQKRERRNNFGEALQVAMEKRAV